MCSAEIALAERFDADRARVLIADAWLATAWVCTERLRDALGDNDVTTMLALHPAIPPGFAREIVSNGDNVRCILTPESPALLDATQGGWIGALARGETRGIEGIVQPIDPHAKVIALEVQQDTLEIVVQTNALAAPVHEPDAVAFMRIGALHSWRFNL
jgi:hypothetical protein